MAVAALRGGIHYCIGNIDSTRVTLEGGITVRGTRVVNDSLSMYQSRTNILNTGWPYQYRIPTAIERCPLPSQPTRTEKEKKSIGISELNLQICG